MREAPSDNVVEMSEVDNGVEPGLEARGCGCLKADFQMFSHKCGNPRVIVII